MSPHEGLSILYVNDANLEAHMKQKALNFSAALLGLSLRLALDRAILRAVYSAAGRVIEAIRR